MSEFYELKKRETDDKKHDVSYWKERCKESEAQNVALSQELIAATTVIDGLTTTVSILEEFLKSIGFKSKNGDSLLDLLCQHGLKAEFAGGKFPVIYPFESSSKKPARLKDVDGIEVELSLAGGLRVGPHFTK